MYDQKYLLPVGLETIAIVVFNTIRSATVNSLSFLCLSNCENYEKIYDPTSAPGIDSDVSSKNTPVRMEIFFPRTAACISIPWHDRDL